MVMLSWWLCVFVFFHSVLSMPTKDFQDSFSQWEEPQGGFSDIRQERHLLTKQQQRYQQQQIQIKRELLQQHKEAQNSSIVPEQASVSLGVPFRSRGGRYGIFWDHIHSLFPTTWFSSEVRCTEDGFVCESDCVSLQTAPLSEYGYCLTRTALVGKCLPKSRDCFTLTTAQPLAAGLVRGEQVAVIFEMVVSGQLTEKPVTLATSEAIAECVAHLLTPLKVSPASVSVISLTLLDPSGYTVHKFTLDSQTGDEFTAPEPDEEGASSLEIKLRIETVDDQVSEDVVEALQKHTADPTFLKASLRAFGLLVDAVTGSEVTIEKEQTATESAVMEAVLEVSTKQMSPTEFSLAKGEGFCKGVAAVLNADPSHVTLTSIQPGLLIGFKVLIPFKWNTRETLQRLSNSLETHEFLDSLNNVGFVGCEAVKLHSAPTLLVGEDPSGLKIDSFGFSRFLDEGRRVCGEASPENESPVEALARRRLAKAPLNPAAVSLTLGFMDAANYLGEMKREPSESQCGVTLESFCQVFSKHLPDGTCEELALSVSDDGSCLSPTRYFSAYLRGMFANPYQPPHVTRAVEVLSGNSGPAGVTQALFLEDPFGAIAVSGALTQRAFSKEVLFLMARLGVAPFTKAAKSHVTAISKSMAHYGMDPSTGKLALVTFRNNLAATPGITASFASTITETLGSISPTNDGHVTLFEFFLCVSASLVPVVDDSTGKGQTKERVRLVQESFSFISGVLAAVDVNGDRDTTRDELVNWLQSNAVEKTVAVAVADVGLRGKDKVSLAVLASLIARNVIPVDLPHRVRASEVERQTSARLVAEMRKNAVLYSKFIVVPNQLQSQIQTFVTESRSRGWTESQATTVAKMLQREGSIKFHVFAELSRKGMVAFKGLSAPLWINQLEHGIEGSDLNSITQWVQGCGVSEDVSGWLGKVFDSWSAGFWSAILEGIVPFNSARAANAERIVNQFKLFNPDETGRVDVDKLTTILAHPNCFAHRQDLVGMVVRASNAPIDGMSVFEFLLLSELGVMPSLDPSGEPITVSCIAAAAVAENVREQYRLLALGRQAGVRPMREFPNLPFARLESQVKELLEDADIEPVDDQSIGILLHALKEVVGDSLEHIALPDFTLLLAHKLIPISVAAGGSNVLVAEESSQLVGSSQPPDVLRVSIEKFRRIRAQDSSEDISKIPLALLQEALRKMAGMSEPIALEVSQIVDSDHSGFATLFEIIRADRAGILPTTPSEDPLLFTMCQTVHADLASLGSRATRLQLETLIAARFGDDEPSRAAATVVAHQILDPDPKATAGNDEEVTLSSLYQAAVSKLLPLESDPQMTKKLRGIALAFTKMEKERSTNPAIRSRDSVVVSLTALGVEQESSELLGDVLMTLSGEDFIRQDSISFLGFLRASLAGLVAVHVQDSPFVDAYETSFSLLESSMFFQSVDTSLLGYLTLDNPEESDNLRQFLANQGIASVENQELILQTIFNRLLSRGSSLFGRREFAEAVVTGLIPLQSLTKQKSSPSLVQILREGLPVEVEPFENTFLPTAEAKEAVKHITRMFGIEGKVRDQPNQIRQSSPRDSYMWIRFENILPFERIRRVNPQRLMFSWDLSSEGVVLESEVSFKMLELSENAAVLYMQLSKLDIQSIKSECLCSMRQCLLTALDGALTDTTGRVSESLHHIKRSPGSPNEAKPATISRFAFSADIHGGSVGAFQKGIGGDLSLSVVITGVGPKVAAFDPNSLSFEVEKLKACASRAADSECVGIETTSPVEVESHADFSNPLEDSDVPTEVIAHINLSEDKAEEIHKICGAGSADGAAFPTPCVLIADRGFIEDSDGEPSLRLMRQMGVVESTSAIDLVSPPPRLIAAHFVEESQAVRLVFDFPVETRGFNSGGVFVGSGSFNFQATYPLGEMTNVVDLKGMTVEDPNQKASIRLSAKAFPSMLKPDIGSAATDPDVAVTPFPRLTDACLSELSRKIENGNYRSSFVISLFFGLPTDPVDIDPLSFRPERIGFLCGDQKNRALLSKQTTKVLIDNPVDVCTSPPTPTAAKGLLTLEVESDKNVGELLESCDSDVYVFVSDGAIMGVGLNAVNGFSKTEVSIKSEHSQITALLGEGGQSALIGSLVFLNIDLSARLVHYYGPIVAQAIAATLRLKPYEVKQLTTADSKFREIEFAVANTHSISRLGRAARSGELADAINGIIDDPLARLTAPLMLSSLHVAVRGELKLDSVTGNTQGTTIQFVFSHPVVVGDGSVVQKLHFLLTEGSTVVHLLPLAEFAPETKDETLTIRHVTNPRISDGQQSLFRDSDGHVTSDRLKGGTLTVDVKGGLVSRSSLRSVTNGPAKGVVVAVV